MGIYLHVGIVCLVQLRDDILHYPVGQDLAEFAGSVLLAPSRDTRQEQPGIGHSVREIAIDPQFYRDTVLLIDELYRCGRPPELVQYLRFTEEVDLQLVFTLKPLAQPYQVGKERMVIGFQVERALILYNIHHLALIHQHRPLPGRHYELAGIDDFVVL